MSFSPASYSILPGATIRDAVECLDRSGRGICFVADAEFRLLDAITDGDIRRAMLAGQNFDTPVSELLARKTRAGNDGPVSAALGTDKHQLLRLMQLHSVHQVPLLDRDGIIVDLVTLDDLLPDQQLPLKAVIMAGGFGTRLRPLTDDIPKPMLPVGDAPLMEHTIRQLKQAGIRRVQITTHFMPDKIQQYFGDGGQLGVELHYVNEEKPLGTAGFLSLLEPFQEPLLVLNGDILTQIDFRALLTFHREHASDMTIAVRRYEFKVPYGVIDSDGSRVCGIVEKPVMGFHVNGGIYILEPVVHGFVPRERRFDMTDLIEALLKAERTVVCFPIREYWLDIGQPGDYEQAQEDIKKWRLAS